MVNPLTHWIMRQQFVVNCGRFSIDSITVSPDRPTARHHAGAVIQAF